MLSQNFRKRLELWDLNLQLWEEKTFIFLFSGRNELSYDIKHLNQFKGELCNFCFTKLSFPLIKHFLFIPFDLF